MDASQTNQQSEFSTELLRVYYDRLFPYEQMFNWFSYGRDPADKVCDVHTRESPPVPP